MDISTYQMLNLQKNLKKIKMIYRHDVSKHTKKIEINVDDLTKSSKHYESVQVSRGGRQFQRRQLVGSDLKTQWNAKINKTMTDLDTQATAGVYSPTLAAGLLQMAKQAGRLLEVEKFLYDVKRRVGV